MNDEIDQSIAMNHRVQKLNDEFMHAFAGGNSLHAVRNWLRNQGIVFDFMNPPEPRKRSFMEGQRVICCGAISTIMPPERGQKWNTDEYVWVKVPGKPGQSYYSTDNVKPLPDGQL